MQDISVNENGSLSLSTRKVLMMAVIVGIFSVVAHLWEWKQRRLFLRYVKYKTFDTAKLNKLLADFDIMVSCEDPYIESFIKKNSEFTHLHKLWTLNSHDYWTAKVKSEIKRRAAV